MTTSKKTAKQVHRVGLPDTPNAEQVHAALMAVKLPKKAKPGRYTTTLTLTQQQSEILDALVLIRQRASEPGTRPMTRAEVALMCFAKGVNEEVLGLSKLPRWSNEDRQLLESLLKRRLPKSAAD